MDKDIPLIACQGGGSNHPTATVVISLFCESNDFHCFICRLCIWYGFGCNELYISIIFTVDRNFTVVLFQAEDNELL